MKKITIALLALFCWIFQVKAQQCATKIDSLITKAVSLKRFNGTVLVSKNGRIVFEKAYGYQDIQHKIENTPNTIFQVGSMTKQFTATVILKLAEQHKLSIDDKISKYFPNLKRGDEITIKNLLTHTGTALRRRDNRIPSAGTVAKFITKSSLLLLSIRRVTSDGTMAEACNVDC